ncbi:hypothetical protein DFH11DRAFT_1268173 [Phellopilus nigrolimitatus]|nr:hypothetical protein DFH11DRAFT_1268173 [Phellopilus nigrolimitatus]
MLESIPAQAYGPTSYYPYEYVQPFQPLGQPQDAAIALGMISPYEWQSPVPMGDTFSLSPPVKYVVGTPMPGSLHSQSRSKLRKHPHREHNHTQPQTLHLAPSVPYNLTSYPDYYAPQPGLRSRASMSFPEPQLYLSPLRGGPSPSHSGRTSSGVTSGDIWVEPEHCDYLVKAVNEMALCKDIFSKWVEQLNHADLGKKDKVENSIIDQINSLAEDAVSALSSSENMLRTYQALARLMDRRLSSIASSANGGDLFASSSRSRKNDDFQTLAIDIKVHSSEISQFARDMFRKLYALQDNVRQTRDKYSFRKKIWGGLCFVFRWVARVLAFSGTVSTFVHPLGLVGTAAMHASSGIASLVSSVCDKIREGYEESNMDGVLHLLREHVPQSVEIALQSLRRFHAAQAIFRFHLDVQQGKASGYMAPNEAARARRNWRKAASLLKLKDGYSLISDGDSSSW